MEPYGTSGWLVSDSTGAAGLWRGGWVEATDATRNNDFASNLNIGAAKEYRVGGTKVLTTRGAALPADATDLTTALALVNAIKARMKATGGHGLVAD